MYIATIQVFATFEDHSKYTLLFNPCQLFKLSAIQSLYFTSVHVHVTVLRNFNGMMARAEARRVS